MYKQASHYRIDLDGLLLFHAIAATGSLTRAAEKVGVPKATLSRRLRRLERDLGTALVKHGHRRLVLTDAGSALYTSSQGLAAEAEALAEYASSLRAEPAGALRVSLPIGYLGSVCARALTKFAARHPRVRLTVQQTDQWVDVSQQPFDIAVHVGKVVNRNLPVRILARMRRHAYAAPEYLKRRGLPVTPADLAAHDCIVSPLQLAAGLWRVIPAAKGRLTSPSQPRATVSDVLLALEMARAGMGVTILPQALAQVEVANGVLQPVLPDWRIPLAQVVATYADRRYMPAQLRTLLDHLAAEFADASIDH
jgi:DNA-binding transcriptional LysR family regulator